LTKGTPILGYLTFADLSIAFCLADWLTLEAAEQKIKAESAVKFYRQKDRNGGHQVRHIGCHKHQVPNDRTKLLHTICCDRVNVTGLKPQ
jgi:hypothetical protein